MDLSLDLMEQGSYQVECSDEGLMCDDIEECLQIVIKALKKGHIAGEDVVTWCTAMLETDRVGFICEEPIRALEKKFET